MLAMHMPIAYMLLELYSVCVRVRTVTYGTYGTYGKPLRIRT